MDGAGQSPKLDTFDGTVKDFWSSRPRRPRRGRKIAGVAAGIGERYDIDPVIIRVAFIVATVMGGFGVLLYVLGWLFLPEEGDRSSGAEALFGKGRSSMSPMFAICLGIVAVIAMSGGPFRGAWYSGGGVIMLALVAAGIFLLHRSRGHVNRPDASSPHVAAPASFHAQPLGAETQPDSGTETAQANPTEPTQVNDPAVSTPPTGWDPLGADPMGWVMPDATPERRTSTAIERRKPRSRVGTVTLGVALLTAAAGSAAVLDGGIGWLTPVHVVGATLAVLGLGMLVGAFTGGGRGLILLAAPLAIGGLVLTSVPWQDFPSGAGTIDEAPRSIEDVRDVYESGMGTVNLDLSGLPDSDEDIDVSVRTGLGTANVIVPEHANVTFTCSSGMGGVDCLGHEKHGPGSHDVKDMTDEGDGDLDITLDVSSWMGTVGVTRG